MIPAMTFLSPKTLSPSPFPLLPHKNPNPRPPFHFHPHSPPTGSLCKSEPRTERGIEFDTGESFFRQESATGRDLGVLAASLHRKSNGGLRVLDAMCGCGIRSLRYLVEAEADFVLANDANDFYRRVILSNMWRVPRRGGSREEDKRWAVTHFDADRVMTEYYLQREYFDLIDVDSFGSDSTYFRPAIKALKYGGLLYVTSTDGYTSGGNRPYHSVASYGAYVGRVPYSNEVGLRMLIGGVVREASVLGYHVTPLFSYYSFHGPVFRVMLRLSRGMLPDKRQYGFIGYCKRCGHSQAFSWDELGGINCPCNKSNVIVLGPLWTGPLHTTTYLTEMLNLAEQWGWIHSGMGLDLEKLLRQMIDESHPGLPPGYIILDEVAKRAKADSPRIKTIMSSLHQKKEAIDLVSTLLPVQVCLGPDSRVNQLIWASFCALHLEGYVACRSHIASNALKTNCPMAGCVRIVKELSGAE